MLLAHCFFLIESLIFQFLDLNKAINTCQDNSKKRQNFHYWLIVFNNTKAVVVNTHYSTVSKRG